ncbi:hypothetical protein [Cerasicoccus maritimus]|uniref:hypothetical protein n=1 Tax=Cerasicoccus maritimus TaxID=490089 RepID=UPI002852638D|nr:hypothetical protein [Cerasicoccus maritimus]
MERKDAEYIAWKQRQDHINNRWSQLYELDKEWGKEAIKYLILMNSGGAVATLSFLGASADIRGTLPPKLALIFFFVGLVSSGCMVAYAYESMNRLFSHWQKDVEAHYMKELDYADLIKRDSSRVPSGKVDRILGYTGLTAFILGFIVGATGLFLT